MASKKSPDITARPALTDELRARQMRMALRIATLNGNAKLTQVHLLCESLMRSTRSAS
ncbi:hypothetical protein [Paraburkholderia ginsengisoli]|uniref:Uncharacterized protein n=1 Tax=Paraburkholderia ginsengisoli TaxID=311231 RepID=A0A7T4T8V3_9BURK|nr:hypothetical protein [Paraburkholderia ginsengisoli]QQC63798.1 hypothetical protein I6I06_16125 [Paraburkholderia ginsengisoli]